MSEMNYPSFPAQHNAQTTQFTQSKLQDIYDTYTQLGLYIVPKLAEKKFPHAHFWAKENRHLRRNRETALRYQSKQNIHGWCVVTGEHSQRLLVIDIDPADVVANGANPNAVYNQIQALSTTGFVLSTPSYGVHLYYRIPEKWDMLTNAAPPIKGVDVRGEGGQVVFIGGFNTYTGAKAEKKGVPDGHTATYSPILRGRYDTIPEMSIDLYEWLQGTTVSRQDTVVKARNYANTEAGQAKLERHFKQPFDARERIVAEALLAVLDNWDENRIYDEWIQVWMAAHHGSDGSPKIRDIFLLHDKIYWSDGEDGRLTFIDNWNNHQHKIDGFTVASLFWLARQAGWMTKTGYEIPDERTRLIDVKYVQEWMDTLDEIPTRLLLHSQTGSGKTHNIKTVWDRLEQPKTVIFVPTKKLATELAQTLIHTHKMPVTLYRDIDTYDIVARTELADAQILVTTLQTFSTKLYPEMKDYGLVYVEESDQLLQQFARGGGGYDASHVDDTQARKGFAVLRDAFENSGVMWLVDATMSKVSLEVAEVMCSTTVDVVRNTRVTSKAPVEMLFDKDNAYQKVFEGLILGERVVCVADTAYEAETMAEIMGKAGALKDKKALVITRHTENKPEVRQFMKDVNTGAEQYALVCYNSVMASGVSITSVMPDRIVQMSTYLPPRVNLQLLNRYRQQKQVYVYCTPRESIYILEADDVVQEFAQRAKLEGQLINMPVVNRLADAELRAYIASISIADTKRQFRDTQGFYAQLLKEDGRSVTFAEETPVMGRIAQSKEAVRAIHKSRKDYLTQTWHETPPIDSDNPALPEYTPLQIAQGEVHAMVEKSLRGNIPDLEVFDPEYVYEVAKHFRKYGFILTAFINQEMAVEKAETYLGDSGRSLGNLRTNVTLVRLLANLNKLYQGIDDILSPETVAKRGRNFMSAITLAKDAYNAVIRRSSQKYDVVYDRYETDEQRAIAFSKIMLSQIGLKQRVTRKKVQGENQSHHSVINLQEARDYLDWRNKEAQTIELSDDELTTIADKRKEVYLEFAGMPIEVREEIFSFIDKNNSFIDVVKAIVGKDDQEW